MTILSRRRFLQIGAGAAGAGAAAVFLPGRPRGPTSSDRRNRATASKRSPPTATSASGSAARSPRKKNGRLWKIEGNPADPLSRGRLCPRGTGGVGALLRPRPPALAAPAQEEPRRGRVGRGHLGRGARLHRREAPEASRPSTGPKRSRSSATASAATSSSTPSRPSARRISSRPPTPSAAGRATSASS